MDGRREWRSALVLQARKPAEVEIIRAPNGTRQRGATRDDERDPGNPVQALVGGTRHGLEACVGKIDVLGAEAAHAVGQKSDAASPTNFSERRQIIEAAGGGLVVHKSRVRERALIEPGGHRVPVRSVHPVSRQALVCDPILRTDLRNTIAIHAVFDDQQATLGGHQRGNHGLDGTGARGGDQGGAPYVGVQRMHAEEPLPRLVLQVEELAFAVAQIRLQEASPYALGERHRPGIEKQHQRTPPAKCRMKRSLTSAGEEGRGN